MLWQGYQRTMNSGVTSNNFNGVADKVVQLQVVHGDLTIN